MSEGPKGFDWKAFTPENSPKTPMDLSADPILQDLSTPNLTVGETASMIPRTMGNAKRLLRPAC